MTMKRKNYLLALFLILVGLQTSQAQILKVWQNGKFDSYDVRTVDSVQFVESFHEWVDLDLPSGTLWATCNVGAHSPEEYGDYFAWGDTKPKSEFTWSNYFDKEDGSSTFKTYNKDGGLTELLPEHDAATVNWGSE